MPLPWKDVHDYLQLPSHTYPFYWQYTDNAEMADAVQNVGHISLGMFMMGYVQFCPNMV